jgi:hypothetical protein
VRPQPLMTHVSPVKSLELSAGRSANATFPPTVMAVARVRIAMSLGNVPGPLPYSSCCCQEIIIKKTIILTIVPHAKLLFCIYMEVTEIVLQSQQITGLLNPSSHKTLPRSPTPLFAFLFPDHANRFSGCDDYQVTNVRMHRI